VSPEHQKKLLARAVKADRADPFASDSNESVRNLGKLALRREEPDPTDSFALGDLCASLSLSPDNVLLITYAGKALLAYRRAQAQSTREVDQKAADEACQRYIIWVMEVAQALPMARNLAVGLWAVSEIPTEKQSAALQDRARKLLAQL